MSVLGKGANPEKGKRYLGLLDQALCNGSWSEVPELARKVDKHAPDRACFTLTARTEARIASASHRPTSAESNTTSSLHGLSDAVPQLVEAISAARQTPDDAYCAKTCLAEIYYVQGDDSSALATLSDADGIENSSGSTSASLGWLEVCSAKALAIRATSLEAKGLEQEMKEVYRAASVQAPGSRSPELRRWTERLLGQACMYHNARASEPTLPLLSESLSAFRSWGSFWARAQPSTSGYGSGGSRLDVSRRQVWKAYYELLSTILRCGLTYTPTQTTSSQLLEQPSGEIDHGPDTSAKCQQRAELKRVEVTYESILLSETKFPHASLKNTDVEAWATLVVSNWKIFCGPSWTDSQLLPDTKEHIGRNVLEILYHAATITFHSTAILRQLFVVHAALGEFDLAMHAFNTYAEIIAKGKARAIKTGKLETGIDDNDTAILTAVEAVRLLCRYGDREHGEKAIEVGSQIRSWLGRQGVTPMGNSENEPSSSENIQADASSIAGPPLLRPETIAAAHRAVGISQAHWARLTYDTESRAGLQNEALHSLQTSAAYVANNVETTFALGRVLVDTRDVPGAIDVVKRCIAANTPPADSPRLYYVPQVSLVPLWHLLALCLTARDEYDSGIRMCDAAFDQFGDATILFGIESSQAASDPEKHTGPIRGVVASMDAFQRDHLLQLKLTRLSLLEATEGTAAAVDSTSDILATYARLFGVSKAARQPPAGSTSAAASVTPSRAGGGTLRSIVGSIRPKRTSVERDTFRPPSNASAPSPPRTSAGSTSRPAPSNGAPIAITVTNEDGVSASGRVSAEQLPHHHHHLHLPFKVRHHGGDFREAGGNLGSSDALHDAAAAGERELAPPVPPKDSDVVDHAVTSTPNDIGTPSSQQSPGIPTDTGRDVRLSLVAPPSYAPPSSASNIHERQHTASLLVQIWLSIGDLYLRADMQDDAEAAVAEAARIVEAFEAEKGERNANARGLFEKGWGGGKSVDALWADVFAARGNLAFARDLPYDAMDYYDEASDYSPDHADAAIGVANLLMDIYDEKLPTEKPSPLLPPLPTASESLLPSSVPASHSSRPSTTNHASQPNPSRPAQQSGYRSRKDPTPAQMDRFAARDRAYMLLSSVSKLGTGWDNSEVWLTLARAHEVSGQVAKAKQALWWVVELENSAPVRGLNEISPGGYAL